MDESPKFGGCCSRRLAERVSAVLSTMGFLAGSFHLSDADRDAHVRRAAFAAFGPTLKQLE